MTFQVAVMVVDTILTFDEVVREGILNNDLKSS